MRCFSRVIILLITTCLLSAGSPCTAQSAVDLQTDLISNSGFETNTTGWTLETDAARDTSVAHTGSASLKLMGNATSSWLVANAGGFTSRSARLSAWIKTGSSDSSSGGASLEVRGLASNGKVTGYVRSVAFATGGAWRKAEIVARVPPNSDSIKITLLNTSAADTAWFDDVSCVLSWLKEIDNVSSSPPQTAPDSIQPTAIQVPRITLSSFERLRAAPKPNFKKGHTLPRLSYWLGGRMAFSTMKELTENWGYALELIAEEQTITSLNNPNSTNFKIYALAASDPDRYPVFLIPRHYWNGGTYKIPETAWCHVDSVNQTPGTRVRLVWKAGADVPLGTLRYHDGAIYKCRQASGSGTNPPTAGGNMWWIEATAEEKEASPGLAIWSPEAPTSIFEETGVNWATPITTLRSLFPTIKTPIVLNGAEYGLGVTGGDGQYWKQDPVVRAARDAYNTANGHAAGDWFYYITAQKLRQETPIATAFRKAVPDRELYINYGCGGARVRTNQNTGWQAWGWDYNMLRDTTDLPVVESYFMGYWKETHDLLSRATNIMGQHIAAGDALSYGFLSGGSRAVKGVLATNINRTDTKVVVKDSIDQWPATWTLQIDDEYMTYSAKDNSTRTVTISARGTNGTVAAAHSAGKNIYGIPDFWVSDPARYMGFLKIQYALGIFGACEGYFSIPYENDPCWLWQFTNLAHVHALYSHLEDFIRNGDLLPGPNKHYLSQDQPAYEFPTGDPTARVVVRKKRATNKWLIAAWAQDGNDRSVTVTIPTLGKVTVQTRVAGSVYTATLNRTKQVVTLIDTDAMNPTARFAIRVLQQTQ